MLWLVEVFEWFWLHRVIVIQSIQDDFWWACRKKYTCMVYHKKKIRHTFIEAKKKKYLECQGLYSSYVKEEADCVNINQYVYIEAPASVA